MAQQDTGLGWSAKEEWLIAALGQIAELTEYKWTITGFENQTVPVCPLTATDVILSGLQIYEGAYNSRNTDYRNGYIGSDTPGCIVCFGFNANSYKLVVFGPQGAHLLYNRPIHSTGNPDLVNIPIGSSVVASGQTLYYGYAQGGDIFYYDRATMYVPVITWSSSLNTFVNNAAANVTVETSTIEKINYGYAVGAIARWYTQAGVIISTPVLISSVSENVEMTTDNPQFNFAKADFLYDGVRFYMGFFDTIGKSYISNLPDADLTQFGAAALEKVFKLIASESFSNIIILNSPDPYEEPPAEEDGGDGENDDEDDVDFTDPPSTAIGATGFLTIFCPSLGQLQNLARFMWNSFDVDNWRRLFANPMDAILGLHIIPVPPVVTGTKIVKVAGISTEIEMDYTSIRYIRRPMGTCDIPKKWGAYLDYNPYTKVSIFLPYIGFKDVDTDDIMGETIALQYMVDILTGACVAELKCGDTVLYSWQGNCANEVPITGSDWRGAIASALGIAGSVAATALTGGASAPMIAGTIASVGANSLNLKPSVNRSGAIAGSAGFMGNQRPYIIRTVPNLVIPADQNKFIGYPSFVNASLGSLTGYNEISAIHLEGIPATGNELSEIETLLKGGVIF